MPGIRLGSQAYGLAAWESGDQSWSNQLWLGKVRGHVVQNMADRSLRSQFQTMVLFPTLDQKESQSLGGVKRGSFPSLPLL